MRNIWRNLVGGFAAALFLLALLSPTIVMAQQFSPRLFPSQQRHYLRFSVNFNSCAFVSLVQACKFGAIPYNSFITNIWTQITTAFNAGTSDTLTIGTATSGAQLMAGVAMTATTAGIAQTVVAANLGIAATGNGIAQTGSNGGFDIWATQTVVGALPTTGAIQVIIEYIAPNDGSCANVAFGATAPGC